MHLLLYASLHQTQLCVRALLYMHVRVHVVYWGYMKYRLHGIRAAKMASGVLRGHGEGRERKWVQRPDSAVYIFCGDLKVAVYPSSLASHLPPQNPSFPPSFALLASATPCVSGQISPTVGSAGLCGGLFILERGLPSGSLHLSKHPPGRCSVFPASHSPPPLLHLHPPHSALSLTPSFLLYHSNAACPLVIPIYRPFSPFSLWPSIAPSFLENSRLSSPNSRLSYHAVIAAFR